MHVEEVRPGCLVIVRQNFLSAIELTLTHQTNSAGAPQRDEKTPRCPSFLTGAGPECAGPHRALLIGILKDKISFLQMLILPIKLISMEASFAIPNGHWTFCPFFQDFGRGEFQANSIGRESNTPIYGRKESLNSAGLPMPHRKQGRPRWG